MRRWLIVTLALLPVGCGPLANFSSNPDGPHTLAISEHKEGDVYRVTWVRTSETDGMAASSGHRGKGGKEETKEKIVFTEEVLEKPAGAKRPTRLRRTYEVVDKSRSGTAVKSHLVGKTAEVEWADDKPKFKVDGQPPTAEQKKELEREFGNTRSKTTTTADMLPGKPVKVGETWPVDRESFVEGMTDTPGVTFDTAHCRITGKLVKVTNVGGKLQAAVEFTMRVPVSDIEIPGVGGFRADDASRMTVTATVEFCLDGSTPGEWTAYNGQGRVGADLPRNGLITVHYTEAGTIREEPVTKK